MKKNSLFIWSLFRLPILIISLYLFRVDLSILIEKYFNLGLVFESIIYLVSTAWIRLLLLIPALLTLILVYLLVKKYFPKSYRLLFILFVFLSFEVLFEYLLRVQNSILRSTFAILILTINLIPEDWLDKHLPKVQTIGIFFITGVGLAEGLFLQSYIFWLTESLKLNINLKKWTWLAGVLLTCFYSFFLITPYNNQRILTLGEKIHANPAVEKFAAGSYNWLELNFENNLLYASGHNVNYMIAYDTNNLNLPPLKSRIQIGKPQSFAYNPILEELYVYKADTQELLYLDAITLELLHSIPIPNISPGDVWVNWQSGTDTITIASEADLEIGVPFVMVNRGSGEIIASIPLPLIATNVTFDLNNNIFYFNSFRDTYLVAWDMTLHQVIHQVEISPRTDRLLYNPTSFEVLVASPQDGAILRYDSISLKLKGEIDTNIGDRTIAIDLQRNLLLVGNFINNYMQVIDLNTQQPISRFYIGPWIRTIVLDSEKGVAYVSTIKDLFKVTYID